MEPSLIMTLGQAIAQDTALVEGYFVAHDIPSPSFDIDAPQDLNIPPNGPVSQAYERLIDNTNKLHLLMMSPSAALQRFGYLDAMAMQFVHRLKIAQYISDHGPATFDEIAESTNVDCGVIRRMLRFAMTNFVFCESPLGTVRHSSLSKRLAEDVVVQGAVGMFVNESFPGSAQVVNSLLHNRGAREPLQCGWALANNAKAPLYEELNKSSPERSLTVMDAMSYLADTSPIDQLLDSYPWSELGQATVVDIGGGRGPVSIALAQKFPGLRCVVQDLELTVRSGEQGLNPILRDRVSFMAHNFFHEQPVKRAEVYFLRYILHDWPEDYGLKILRALIPAFKPGSRVVIHDFAIPEQGTVSDASYRISRVIDLNMMVYFNGQDRELDEWKIFLAKVHPHLKFSKAYHPRMNGEDQVNKALAIVEAVWTGEYE